MAGGYETFQQIEAAIADLRAQEKQLAGKLEADNQARAHLMRERAATIRRLAETRVSGAVADGVIDQADRLEADVHAILKARQATIEGLEARAAKDETAHAGALDRSHLLAEEAATLEAELDEFGARAREALSADPTYRDLVSRRDTLAGQLERAEDKAEQAEADRLEKGKPYEADPLFMYLWERNYRGKSYTSTGLIRWLDGKVAALVGYNGARANYAMLNEIPVRLREHVERLAQAREVAAKKVETIEAEKIAELMDDGLPARVASLRASQADVDAELAALETAMAETASQLNRYAEGRDEAYRHAIEKLSNFLEQSRYNRLVSEARRTDAMEDDRLVDEIGDINSKTRRLSRDMKERQRELKEVERRRDEMVKVAAEFRQKSYHRQGSVFDFDDDDWEDVLKNVVRGGLTVAEWWLRAQMRQRWSGRSGDAWRRSSGLPPFDFDFDWGSGDGKRSRRSGRRRSDDWGNKDFRTGGGF
jgi:chromosome segregation ATPase